LYLEVFRYHHIELSTLLAGWALPRDVGARPGEFVRAVVICAVTAPMMFLTFAAWLIVHTRSRARPRIPTRATAWSVGTQLFGLVLIVLGLINQAVRHPPIVTDLTLQTGNVGFVFLGLTLVVIGGWASGRQKAHDSRKARVIDRHGL
jgi:hypothetical protein